MALLCACTQALKLIRAKQQELKYESKAADEICQRLHVPGCGKVRGLEFDGLLNEWVLLYALAPAGAWHGMASMQMGCHHAMFASSEHIQPCKAYLASTRGQKTLKVSTCTWRFLIHGCSLYSALDNLGALVLDGDWEDDSLSCLLQKQRQVLYSFSVEPPSTGQLLQGGSGGAGAAADVVPRKRVVMNTPGNQILGGLFLHQVRGCVHACIHACLHGTRDRICALRTCALSANLCFQLTRPRLNLGLPCPDPR